MDSHPGEGIAQVQLKDLKRKENGYDWVNLGDGDVHWAAGSTIAEFLGGDEACLRDVSRSGGRGAQGWPGEKTNWLLRQANIW